RRPTDSPCSRPRRLAPDIDDVSALFKQLQSVLYGLRWIGKLSAIGKRVRCYIEHTHHQRAFSQRQHARTDAPFDYPPHTWLLTVMCENCGRSAARQISNHKAVALPTANADSRMLRMSSARCCIASICDTAWRGLCPASFRLALCRHSPVRT